MKVEIKKRFLNGKEVGEYQITEIYKEYPRRYVVIYLDYGTKEKFESEISEDELRLLF